MTHQSIRVRRGESRTNTGIEPYSGPWNARAAAHLLRRTTFGSSRSDVALLAARSLDDAVQALLQSPPEPPPPIDPTTNQTWVDKAFNSTLEGQYIGYLRAWWVGLMVTQGISIREKMVLFWHNHFATEYDTVPDSRCMHRQNSLFRQHALGNIKELVKAVTIDPAMLMYLNGARNRGDGNNIPDENYARELQELFTIGKGPQIGPGDYTNYTEQDVKAAARVLTGWRPTGYRDTKSAAISSSLNVAQHDAKDKQFSYVYQNTRIIGGADGARELNDLVEMIFSQPETARFLCRKLYRWFVFYAIDQAVEQQVISPLADILRQNNYEVKPVLDVLLRSAHFFDEENIGCCIKNPLDFVVGAYRALEMPMPSAVVQPGVYNSLMSSLRNTASTLQLNPLDPPNVAGWSAYYQSPDFYRLWINTATLPVRWSYTDSLINGLKFGSSTFVTDTLPYIQQFSSPGNPYQLVTDIATALFAMDITDNQSNYLVSNVLMPGLPDYEWGTIWQTYVSDPNNTAKRNAVISRVKNLLKFMLRMGEFQLA